MSAPSDWYKHFFHGVAVEMWRQCMPPEYTKRECDFLESVLKPPSGGRLLDVPCGHGRHLLELAARGYQLTGVDLSLDEVTDARERARSRNLDVELLLGDMRELPWSERFDGGYCMGNAFGYLEDGGDAAFLKALAKGLKPRARFVLETGTAAETLLPNLKPRSWYPIGDILFLVANEYDAVRGLLKTEYTFVRDGKLDRRLGTQRVYMLRELIGLCADAGLTVDSTFGSAEGEPFVLGSHRLFLVATRT